MMSILLLLAVQAADNPAASLQPSAQADILAGTTACLGSTLNPDTRPARFSGWTPVAVDPKKKPDPDGKFLTRGNVMIAYKPGDDGGCVVMARTDDAFDQAAFYTQLDVAVGASVPRDGKSAPVALPDGEILIPLITVRPAEPAPNIILVFANSAGKYAKKEN